ncbi:MAG: Trm112 family protein [Thermoprotei archaeon]|nr:MAG: Trm112 family protein [Thermoprotei archaeon]
MKYRLLDLLACPICKHFPLRLIVIETKEYPERELPFEKPLCELFCSFLNRDVEKEKKEEYPCEKCIKLEVVTGVLVCSQCNRWYPIIEEIPRMLPDDLRDKEEDIEFLKKYKDKLPKEVVYSGVPVHL